MKDSLFHLAPVAISFIVSVAHAEEAPPNISPSESNNKIITITDTGIEPKVLSMRKEDRIAFFLNASSESLITLSLSFGNSATHCASENLKIDEGGGVRSIRPIAPKDFATTCFHDPGTYSYTIYGIPNSPKGVQGTIQVR
jgi:hypothetical protein